jgi:molecular chaperone GrpE
LSRERESEEEGAPAQAPDAPESAASIQDELERIRREAEDASDRALRTLAEFDNYRRRSERERREAQDAGAANVLRELLDVADNFDRALGHGGDDVPAAFLEGMRLVARGLHDLLDRRGVKRIESVGRTFDPHLHEAIASEPSARHAPHEIVREIQPGYVIGERVLRPSKVIVARAASESEA